MKVEPKNEYEILKTKKVWWYNRYITFEKGSIQKLYKKDGIYYNDVGDKTTIRDSDIKKVLSKNVEVCDFFYAREYDMISIVFSSFVFLIVFLFSLSILPEQNPISTLLESYFVLPFIVWVVVAEVLYYFKIKKHKFKTISKILHINLEDVLFIKALCLLEVVTPLLLLLTCVALYFLSALWIPIAIVLWILFSYFAYK